MNDDVNRLYTLDFLKITAAVIIVFTHYQQIFEITFDNMNFYYGRFLFGYLVELFFIISGFLSTLNYADADYIYRKMARIYPMAILSTTFAYVIYLIFYKQTGILLLEGLGINASFFRFFCNSLLLFQNGIFYLNFNGVNNPLWYLSVLLVLYIIFYLEHKISKRYKININYIHIVVLIIFICVRVFHVDYPIFNEVLARGVIPFTIGSLLVFVNDKFKKHHISIYSFIALIVVVIFITLNMNVFLNNQQAVLTYIIYPLLLLFVLNSKIVNRIVNHRIIGELGKISFEMYIWHLPLLYVFMIINYYSNALPIHERWFMILFTVLIFIWSTIMYYFVEKPINRKIKALKQ